MYSGFWEFVILLLVWASLGSVYWQIRANHKKQLDMLNKIEKRLATLENKLS